MLSQQSPENIAKSMIVKVKFIKNGTSSNSSPNKTGILVDEAGTKARFRAFGHGAVATASSLKKGRTFKLSDFKILSLKKQYRISDFIYQIAIYSTTKIKSVPNFGTSTSTSESTSTRPLRPLRLLSLVTKEKQNSEVTVAGILTDYFIEQVPFQKFFLIENSFPLL